MADEREPTAAERTIPMWDEPTERLIEPEERQAKVRSDFDPDAPLISWVSEASAQLPDGHRLLRIAKFRNGRRGLQLVRGDLRRPGFDSTFVLHPDEYLMLAQCIFRDSRHIQQLVSRFPVGTDPTVDAIRDFLSLRIE